MDEITIEEAEKIFLEAKKAAMPEETEEWYDPYGLGKLELPIFRDSRRAGLKAVIEAVEARWQRRMDNCCESASYHYDSSYYNE